MTPAKNIIDYAATEGRRFMIFSKGLAQAAGGTRGVRVQLPLRPGDPSGTARLQVTGRPRPPDQDSRKFGAGHADGPPPGPGPRPSLPGNNLRAAASQEIELRDGARSMAPVGGPPGGAVETKRPF